MSPRRFAATAVACTPVPLDGARTLLDSLDDVSSTTPPRPSPRRGNTGHAVSWLDNPALPLTIVDACDARDYSSWAGKRHCHGSSLVAAYELGLACGLPQRPVAACPASVSGLVAVGTSRCTAGGIFDLIGNVEEWFDAPGDAENPNAGAFGGSFNHTVACGANPPHGVLVRDRVPTVGFRCCADAR